MTEAQIARFITHTHALMFMISEKQDALDAYHRLIAGVRTIQDPELRRRMDCVALAVLNQGRMLGAIDMGDLAMAKDSLERSREWLRLAGVPLLAE